MIRATIGFILILGGMGGIEHGTINEFPMDSLMASLTGVTMLLWVASSKKLKQ